MKLYGIQKPDGELWGKGEPYLSSNAVFVAKNRCGE